MAYKDGFVIEYRNQGVRISCYKCHFFDKDDKSCRKTGVYVPDVANEKWRTCRFFELADHWNTEAMRAKANRIRARAQREQTSSRVDETERSSRPSPKVAPQAPRDKVEAYLQKQSTQSPAGAPRIKVGAKVTSPKYGEGTIAHVDGKWVTVLFRKPAKRIRLDLAAALKNGSLRL